MNAREVASQLAAEFEQAGVPDASFEAELLTRFAAGISRASFFAGADLDAGACERLRDLAGRRLRREPAAYLMGHREFYGLDFVVGPGVLIPRPETEMLVEVGLAHLVTSPGATLVDVGTGSGCVAVAIAANAPHARVVAVDVSEEALVVARHNARRHNTGVEFVEGDLTTSLGRADVVVANLPYVPDQYMAALQPEIREWEPRVALFGGEDGLDLVRRLIADCGERIRPELLAMELGIGQANVVAALVEAAGAEAAILEDLAGIPRVVTGRWT